MYALNITNIAKCIRLLNFHRKALSETLKQSVFFSLGTAALCSIIGSQCTIHVVHFLLNTIKLQ